MRSSRNDFPDETPVGIVDDLDIDVPVDADVDASAPAPRVTGILTGQVLATRILGGRPPRAKLQGIPWRMITKIGTVVQLSSVAEEFESLWLEHWLRDHIIRHIPGGRRAAQ